MPSLHPFYGKQDLVRDAALSGRWSEQRNGHAWTFAEADGQSYRLAHVDEEGRQSNFTAHLFRTEGTLFLDLAPLEPDARLNPIYALHTVPAHNVLRVMNIGEVLQLAFLSYSGVKAVLARNPGAIAHACLEHGEYVLTAQTFDLQRFILQDAGTRHAGTFESQLDLVRVEDSHRPV
jgi:hypothetical protein